MEIPGNAFDVLLRVRHHGVLLFARAIATGILALLVTGGLVLFTDLPVHPAYVPIDEALARARLDAETRAAMELGFVLDRSVTIGSPSQELDLEVGAGECVALIATAWGLHRVRSVTAVPAGSRPTMYAPNAVLASGYPRGLVAHGQACSDEAATWRVGVDAVKLGEWEARREKQGPFTGGALHVLRAPSAVVGRRLDRGYVLRPDASAPQP